MDQDEEALCRICRCEAEPDSPLKTPCKCTGSVGLVHDACVKAWLRQSGRQSCELCKVKYRWRPIFPPTAPAVLPRSEVTAAALRYVYGLRWLALHYFTALVVWGIFVPWCTCQIYRFSIHFNSFTDAVSVVFVDRVRNVRYLVQDVLCGYAIIAFLVAAASIHSGLGDFFRMETDFVTQALRARAIARRRAILQIRAALPRDARYGGWSALLRRLLGRPPPYVHAQPPPVPGPRAQPANGAPTEDATAALRAGAVNIRAAAEAAIPAVPDVMVDGGEAMARALRERIRRARDQRDQRGQPQADGAAHRVGPAAPGGGLQQPQLVVPPPSTWRESALEWFGDRWLLTRALPRGLAAYAAAQVLLGAFYGLPTTVAVAHYACVPGQVENSTEATSIPSSSPCSSLSQGGAPGSWVMLDPPHVERILPYDVCVSTLVVFISIVIGSTAWLTRKWGRNMRYVELLRADEREPFLRSIAGLRWRRARRLILRSLLVLAVLARLFSEVIIRTSRSTSAVLSADSSAAHKHGSLGMYWIAALTHTDRAWQGLEVAGGNLPLIVDWVAYVQGDGRPPSPVHVRSMLHNAHLGWYDAHGDGSTLEDFVTQGKEYQLGNPRLNWQQHSLEERLEDVARPPSWPGLAWPAPPVPPEDKWVILTEPTPQQIDATLRLYAELSILTVALVCTVALWSIPKPERTLLEWQVHLVARSVEVTRREQAAEEEQLREHQRQLGDLLRNVNVGMQEAQAALARLQARGERIDPAVLAAQADMAAFLAARGVALPVDPAPAAAQPPPGGDEPQPLPQAPLAAAAPPQPAAPAGDDAPPLAQGDDAQDAGVGEQVGMHEEDEDGWQVVRGAGAARRPQDVQPEEGGMPALPLPQPARRNVGLFNLLGDHGPEEGREAEGPRRRRRRRAAREVVGEAQGGLEPAAQAAPVAAAAERAVAVRAVEDRGLERRLAETDEAVLDLQEDHGGAIRIQQVVRQGPRLRGARAAAGRRPPAAAQGLRNLQGQANAVQMAMMEAQAEANARADNAAWEAGADVGAGGDGGDGFMVDMVQALGLPPLPLSEMFIRVGLGLILASGGIGVFIALPIVSARSGIVFARTSRLLALVFDSQAVLWKSSPPVTDWAVHSSDILMLLHGYLGILNCSLGLWVVVEATRWMAIAYIDVRRTAIAIWTGTYLKQDSHRRKLLLIATSQLAAWERAWLPTPMAVAIATGSPLSRVRGMFEHWGFVRGTVISARVMLIMTIRMVLSPLISGILLDWCAAPMMGGSGEEGVAWATHHPLSYAVTHWVYGIVFLTVCSAVILQLREGLRYELLGRYTAPLDMTVSMLRRVMDRPLMPQLRSVALSFCITSALALLFVRVPASVLASEGIVLKPRVLLGMDEARLVGRQPVLLSAANYTSAWNTSAVHTVPALSVLSSVLRGLSTGTYARGSLLATGALCVPFAVANGSSWQAGDAWTPSSRAPHTEATYDSARARDMPSFPLRPSCGPSSVLALVVNVNLHRAPGRGMSLSDVMAGIEEVEQEEEELQGKAGDKSTIFKLTASIPSTKQWLAGQTARLQHDPRWARNASLDANGTAGAAETRTSSHVPAKPDTENTATKMFMSALSRMIVRLVPSVSAAYSVLSDSVSMLVSGVRGGAASAGSRESGSAAKKSAALFELEGGGEAVLQPSHGSIQVEHLVLYEGSREYELIAPYVWAALDQRAPTLAALHGWSESVQGQDSSLVWALDLVTESPLEGMMDERVGALPPLLMHPAHPLARACRNCTLDAGLLWPLRKAGAVSFVPVQRRPTDGSALGLDGRILHADALLRGDGPSDEELAESAERDACSAAWRASQLERTIPAGLSPAWFHVHCEAVDKDGLDMRAPPSSPPPLWRGVIQPTGQPALGIPTGAVRGGDEEALSSLSQPPAEGEEAQAQVRYQLFFRVMPLLRFSSLMAAISKADSLKVPHHQQPVESILPVAEAEAGPPTGEDRAAVSEGGYVHSLHVQAAGAVYMATPDPWQWSTFAPYRIPMYVSARQEQSGVAAAGVGNASIPGAPLPSTWARWLPHGAGAQRIAETSVWWVPGERSIEGAGYGYVGAGPSVFSGFPLAESPSRAASTPSSPTPPSPQAAAASSPASHEDLSSPDALVGPAVPGLEPALAANASDGMGDTGRLKVRVGQVFSAGKHAGMRVCVRLNYTLEQWMAERDAMGATDGHRRGGGGSKGEEEEAAHTGEDEAHAHTEETPKRKKGASKRKYVSIHFQGSGSNTRLLNCGETDAPAVAYASTLPPPGALLLMHIREPLDSMVTPPVGGGSAQQTEDQHTELPALLSSQRIDPATVRDESALAAVLGHAFAALSPPMGGSASRLLLPNGTVRVEMAEQSVGGLLSALWSSWVAPILRPLWAWTVDTSLTLAQWVSTLVLQGMEVERGGEQAQGLRQDVAKMLPLELFEAHFHRAQSSAWSILLLLLSLVYTLWAGLTWVVTRYLTTVADIARTAGLLPMRLAYYWAPLQLPLDAILADTALLLSLEIAKAFAWMLQTAWLDTLGSWLGVAQVVLPPQETLRVHAMTTPRDLSLWVSPSARMEGGGEGGGDSTTGGGLSRRRKEHSTPPFLEPQLADFESGIPSPPASRCGRLFPTKAVHELSYHRHVDGTPGVGKFRPRVGAWFVLQREDIGGPDQDGSWVWGTAQDELMHGLDASEQEGGDASTAAGGGQRGPMIRFIRAQDPAAQGLRAWPVLHGPNGQAEGPNRRIVGGRHAQLAHLVPPAQPAAMQAIHGAVQRQQRNPVPAGGGRQERAAAAGEQGRTQAPLVPFSPDDSLRADYFAYLCLDVACAVGWEVQELVARLLGMGLKGDVGGMVEEVLASLAKEVGPSAVQKGREHCLRLSASPVGGSRDMLAEESASAAGGLEVEEEAEEVEQAPAPPAVVQGRDGAAGAFAAARRAERARLSQLWRSALPSRPLTYTYALETLIAREAVDPEWAYVSQNEQVRAEEEALVRFRTALWGDGADPALSLSNAEQVKARVRDYAQGILMDVLLNGDPTCDIIAQVRGAICLWPHDGKEWLQPATTPSSSVLQVPKRCPVPYSQWQILMEKAEIARHGYPVHASVHVCALDVMRQWGIAPTPGEVLEENRSSSSSLGAGHKQQLRPVAMAIPADRVRDLPIVYVKPDPVSAALQSFLACEHALAHATPEVLRQMRAQASEAGYDMDQAAKGKLAQRSAEMAGLRARGIDVISPAPTAHGTEHDVLDVQHRADQQVQRFLLPAGSARVPYQCRDRVLPLFAFLPQSPAMCMERDTGMEHGAASAFGPSEGVWRPVNGPASGVRGFLPGLDGLSPPPCAACGGTQDEMGAYKAGVRAASSPQCSSCVAEGARVRQRRTTGQAPVRVLLVPQPTIAAPRGARGAVCSLLTQLCTRILRLILRRLLRRVMPVWAVVLMVLDYATLYTVRVPVFWLSTAFFMWGVTILALSACMLLGRALLSSLSLPPSLLHDVHAVLVGAYLLFFAVDVVLVAYYAALNAAAGMTKRVAIACAASAAVLEERWALTAGAGLSFTHGAAEWEVPAGVPVPAASSTLTLLQLSTGNTRAPVSLLARVQGWVLAQLLLHVLLPLWKKAASVSVDVGCVHKVPSSMSMRKARHGVLTMLALTILLPHVLGLAWSFLVDPLPTLALPLAVAHEWAPRTLARIVPEQLMRVASVAAAGSVESTARGGDATLSAWVAGPSSPAAYHLNRWTFGIILLASLVEAAFSGFLGVRARAWVDLLEWRCIGMLIGRLWGAQVRPVLTYLCAGLAFAYAVLAGFGAAPLLLWVSSTYASPASAALVVRVSTWWCRVLLLSLLAAVCVSKGARGWSESSSGKQVRARVAAWLEALRIQRYAIGEELENLKQTPP